jgi:hypothetical protein
MSFCGGSRRICVGYRVAGMRFFASFRMTNAAFITAQREKSFVESEWLRSTLTFALELRLILMSSGVMSGSVSSLR